MPQAAAPELRTELESSWTERLQSKGGLEREVYKTILRARAPETASKAIRIG